MYSYKSLVINKGINLRHEELNGSAFRATPRGHFDHEALDAFVHQFCSFQAPCHRHLL